MTAARPQRIPYRARVQAKIRPYSAADLDDVVRFRISTFGPAASIAQADYVRWMYDRPLDGDRPSLWLFRSDDQIEGFHGVMRTTLHVAGRPLDALWAAELFVSPHYQLRGVGPVLAEVATEQTLSMATEVTEAAKKAFLRSGWADLGEVALYARPIDVAAFSKARGRSPRSAVGKAIDLGLRGSEALAGALNRRSGVRLVEIARFDERSDEVWASAAPHYGVIARRDAATLNWRFVDYPKTGMYRCFYVERSDAVMGHAVFRFGRHRGVDGGWLVDFLCAPRSARVLLAECVRWMRANGVEAVYCVHQPGRLARAFAVNGFLRRRTGWPLMVCAEAVPDSMRSKVLDARAWYITGADSNLDRPREGIVYAT